VAVFLATVTGACGYVGFVGVPTDFDFFMRESFRGDEVKDRDFEYTTDYFLNAFSFRHLTSSDSIWMTDPQGYRLAMGSVTSDEFFLDHEAKVAVALLPRFSFHYRFVQAEDYDSRYLRNLVGLSYDISRHTGAYGFIQLNGFKKDIDVGGGMLITTTPVRLNVGFVFPKAFLNMKSKTNERFERQAFGLGTVTTMALSSRLSLSARLFHNFPLELEKPREALTFKYRRFVYGVAVAYQLNSAINIHLGLYGEDTEKERLFSGASNVDNARITRTALRITLVYTRVWPNGTLLDTGVFFHRFREPTRFPLTPLWTIVRERTEGFLFGQLALHVWKGFRLVPGLFVGLVDAHERRPNTGLPATGGESFEAKVSLALAYRFSDRAYLQLQPSYDLDDQIFGGAGPNLVVMF
jgi:hypothetical protein